MSEENEMAAVEAALMDENHTEDNTVTAASNENDAEDISDHIKAEKVEDDDIKAAQDDIKNVDVLVCGSCNNVFHFIEAFTEHKTSGECDGQKQVLNSIGEAKSQVWAFFLWKAAKIKEEGGTNKDDWSTNSWNLYQRWCKVPIEVRKTWLDAGKNLQDAAVIAHANLSKSKAVKSKQQMTTQQLQQQQKTLLELQKELEDDETEIMSTLGLTSTHKKAEQQQGAGGGGAKDIIGVRMMSDRMTRSKTGTPLKIPKKLDDDDNEFVFVKTKAGINKVIRKTLKSSKQEEETEGEIVSEEEYIVEKIVAKRVNPKTKQPEYLLKWEGCASDQNTWEPLSNLGTCTKLVQEFEKNLARQKARKALEASKAAAKAEDSAEVTSSSRPVRDSARKAINQVKEWMNIGSNKRKFDSEEDDGDADYEDTKHMSKKHQNGGLENLIKKKFLGNVSPSKTPVLVANSKGVMRVDPNTLPNLTSGVYILSSQAGLIKVDDPTALKLTEAMKTGDRKVSEVLNPKVMINETEIRKIPSKNVQNKINLLKKELGQTGVVKKDNLLSPNVKIIQKSSMSKMPLPLRLSSPKISDQLKLVTSKLSSNQKQPIVLGYKNKGKPGPLPGPIQSPLRPPILKPRVTIKSASAKKNTVQQLRLSQFHGMKKDTVTIEKFTDEDFDGGLPDEFPKADEPIAPPSPSRPLTLCPLTGEVLGKAEGEKTPPQTADECILPDLMGDEGDVMRVEMSPGGTITQYVTAKQHQQQQQQQQQQQTKKQPVRKQQRKTVPINTPVVVDTEGEQEFISIEGEDGIIYQITPEQQQLLLNNGTLTVDGRIITQDGEGDVMEGQDDGTELVIENGQLVQRVIQEEDGSQDGGTILMHAGDEDGQIILQEGDTEMTLDQAVQEAVSNEATAVAAATTATAVGDGEFYQETDGVVVSGQEDNQQMVAQIVQAEPPTPGGGPRKVVLLLPDGSLIHTEMDEEQYQSLDFEK